MHKPVLAAAAGTTVGQGKQFDFCLSAAVLVQEPWESSGSAFCMKKIKFSRRPGVQLGSQHRVQCLGAAGPFAGAARTLPHFSQPIFAGEISGLDANSFLVFKVRNARGKLGLPENC